MGGSKECKGSVRGGGGGKSCSSSSSRRREGGERRSERSSGRERRERRRGSRERFVHLISIKRPTTVDLICLAKLTSLSRDFDRESERYRSTSRSQSSKLLETLFVNHVVGRTFLSGRRPDRARREGRRREEEEYGYSPVRSQGKEFIFSLHLFGFLHICGENFSKDSTFRL